MHWYTVQGKPYHKHKGKDISVAKARELGLFPSVSAIVDLMPRSDALERWKIKEISKRVFDAPCPDFQDALDYAYASHFKALEKTQETGTSIHNAIEKRLLGLDHDLHQETVDVVMDWLEVNYGKVDWKTEHTFSHPDGYGGTCDLHSEDVVIDFKTKDFNPGDKVRGYPNHAAQLALYSRGLDIRGGEHVNLFISRNKPCVSSHVWQSKTIHKHKSTALCALKMWQSHNGFNQEN